MNLSVLRPMDRNVVTPRGFSLNSLYSIGYSDVMVSREHRPLILLNEATDECLTWRPDG